MKFVKIVGEILIGLYGLALTAAFLLSGRFMYADTVRHFLPQVLFAGLCVSLVTIAFKSWKNGALCLLLVGISWFGLVHPLDMSVSVVQNPDLFMMNTLYFNKDNQSIVDHIVSTKPKTVALIEVYPDFEKALAGTYGEADVIYYEKGLSIGVWSLEVPVATDLNLKGDPFARVEYQDYILYVVHPRPPVEQAHFTKQHEYFKEISRQANQDRVSSGKEVYVVGDYNAAPYSRVFQAYFSDWNYSKIYSWQRLFPWGLAIDNIVSSIPVEVTATPVLSSDHSGLQVRFPQN
jgi:hypothetical protein